MLRGGGGSLPGLSGPGHQGGPFLLHAAAHLGTLCSPSTPTTMFAPFLSATDFWHQKNADYNNSPFHISQCFVLKLSDLHVVNVGLFDQYFRLTGEWPLCFCPILGEGQCHQWASTFICGCIIAGRVYLLKSQFTGAGGSSFRNC